jgi:hypothetical protein
MAAIYGRDTRAYIRTKSILHGRDLLKEDLVWRVGDGENIQIWDQNWIPRPSLQRPMGHRTGVSVQKVKDLLLLDGSGWNIDK